MQYAVHMFSHTHRSEQGRIRLFSLVNEGREEWKWREEGKD